MRAATTRAWALSPAELGTTAAAAALSTAGYLAGGLPYLSRGVLGDLVGFVLLGAVGTVRGGRVRHEAAVCLALIGVVLLLDPRWPLRVAEPVWWAVFTPGLLGYLVLRRRVLTDRAPG